MKNIYLKLPLLALFLVLIGCQTEELKTSDNEDEISGIQKENFTINSKIKVKNDMLSFSSREDYDAAIENLAQLGDENFSAWEKKLGFASMRGVLTPDELSNRGIEDPLLATIINPDGLIEIAGNIFALDMLTEQVTMIPSNEYKSSGLPSKGKRVFSTNDDILDILDGTEEVSETARRYCGSRISTSTVNVGGLRYNYVMEYRRAGFLNTLRAIIRKRIGNNPVSTVDIRSKGNTFYRNKKRCIKENNRRSTYVDVLKYSYLRIYNSSRRLKAFDFDVEFEVNVNYGTPQQITVKKSDRMSCKPQDGC